MTLHQETKIQEFLQKVYQFSLKENWDESAAQDLIMWGADVYKEHYLRE